MMRFAAAPRLAVVLCSTSLGLRRLLLFILAFQFHQIDARSSQKPYRSALCIGSMQNPYPHAKIARDSDKPPRKWEHAYPDFLQTVSSDAQHYCGMLVKEKHFERKNVFTLVGYGQTKKMRGKVKSRPALGRTEAQREILQWLLAGFENSKQLEEERKAAASTVEKKTAAAGGKSSAKGTGTTSSGGSTSARRKPGKAAVVSSLVSAYRKVFSLSSSSPKTNRQRARARAKSNSKTKSKSKPKSKSKAQNKATTTATTVAPAASAGPPGVFLLYFSGHGMNARRPSRKDSENFGGALVFADDKNLTSSAGAVSFTDIVAMWTATKNLYERDGFARNFRLLVVVDACFSGKLVNQLRDYCKRAEKEEKEKVVANKGRSTGSRSGGKVGDHEYDHLPCGGLNLAIQSACEARTTTNERLAQHGGRIRYGGELTSFLLAKNMAEGGRRRGQTPYKDIKWSSEPWKKGQRGANKRYPDYYASWDSAEKNAKRRGVFAYLEGGPLKGLLGLRRKRAKIVRGNNKKVGGGKLTKKKRALGGKLAGALKKKLTMPKAKQH